MGCYNNHSISMILSLLLIMLILDSKVITLSRSCQTECGNIRIPYPFGVEKGCYLDEWYKIQCRNATFPFLSKMDMEVVNISLAGDEDRFYRPTSFGSIRAKIPITSVGCSRDGKESGSVLNLKGSPFFLGTGNSFVAVGCNGKASLTNMEPIMVGCELNCTSLASKEISPIESIPFLTKPVAQPRHCLILTLRFVQRTKGKEKEAAMVMDVALLVYRMISRLNR